MSNIKISFLGYDDNPPSGLKALTAEFKPKILFSDYPTEDRIQIKIENTNEEDNCKLVINLDLKQAIKFSKTLQHEIYKLKNQEVNNG
jgi:hypothetical protein